MRAADGGAALLPWIVAFKAFKSTTLLALGIALLTTRHSDPVELLFSLALAVHLPFSSRLFDRALNLALNLSVGKEIALAITAFGYAALMGTEGVVLYLRKSWARWFTIVATASLIPLEVYEIAREPHFMRVAISIVNIGIVVYLYRRPEIFEIAPPNHVAL